MEPRYDAVLFDDDGVLTEPTYRIEDLEALRGIVRERTPATDNPSPKRGGT